VSLGNFGRYRLWFFNGRKVELGGAEELMEGEFEGHRNVSKLEVTN
jgi:hypothetical protein